MTLWTLALLACNGDDPTPDDSTPPIEAACTDDAGCEAWEICEADVCEAGDRNESQQDAVPLLWESAETGYLQTAGDEDWFSFSSEGGEWVRVQTVAETADTRVTLYTPSGRVLGVEDDHPLGSVTTYDSVLHAWLEDAGTYLVKVEDDEGGAGANAAWSYTVEVVPFSATTSEADSFEDPSVSVTVSEGSLNNIGVVLEEAGDADWISLSFPSDPSTLYIVGSSMDRGTEMTPLVELWSADGEQLLSKVSPTRESAALHMDVPGGQALLKVSDADGGGGDNAWTTLHTRLVSGEEDYEREVEDNGDPDDAQTLANVSSPYEGQERDLSRVWGDLGQASDEDWYAIQVEDGRSVAFNGYGDAAGSLIDDDVLIELWDADYTLLATGEPLIEGDSVPDLAYTGPLDGGTYYVRVVGDGEGRGHFYYLVVFQKVVE